MNETLGIYTNPTDNNEEVFDSLDLYECLEYAKQTNDFNHLETAICVALSKSRKAREIIEGLISQYSLTDNIDLTKKLTELKKIQKL